MVENYLSSRILCIIILFQLSHFLLQTHAYPDGAPERTCRSMAPFHGGERSLITEIPYEIKLDRVFVRGLGSITITVTSKDPKMYKLAGAFFIVKRANTADSSFGMFKPDSGDWKTVDCFKNENSGLTHANNDPKTRASFKWIAPNETNARYELHATFVRDYNNFWTDSIYPEEIIVDVDAPLSASGRVTGSVFTFTLCSLITILFGFAYYS